MASKQGSKKPSNASKKRSNKGKQKTELRENGMLQDEIILVITLVISILLFLSNFHLGGKVGKFLSGFIFGMIGLEAYILPIVVFFGTAFYISNIGNRIAGRKIMSAIIGLIAMMALIQLITTPYDKEMRILEYYVKAAQIRGGGGLIGGILVMILCGLFEPVFTYIILTAVILICIIVITGKALLTLMAKKSKATLIQRKEYHKLRQEQGYEQQSFTVTEAITRRPPKTFVLDQDGSAVDTKESKTKQKDKWGRKEEPKLEPEIPLVNLGYLNADTQETIQIQQYNGGDTVSELLPYEEELKIKFGNSETVEQDEVWSREYQETVKAEPLENMDFNQVEQNSHTDESTVDEKKQKKASKEEPASIEEMDINQVMEEKEYIFPPFHLLSAPKSKAKGMTERSLKETAMKLQSTLESFGVHVTITNVSCGPSVTRYELQPEQGVKVSRITSLADDIKLNLAAADVRIEAPIPGKAAVGIEVPNVENSMVSFREMIESKEFGSHPSDIAFAVGKDIGGQTVVTDIAKMPHLLIAGATGSGKSVCINTLIMSILYKANPSDVRLIMVDPKVVELNVYNGIPHLLIPVVTDPKKASAALNWAVMEMTERYKKFADIGVRDLKGYNEKVAEVKDLQDENYQKLPQIVIIIDELADLMMVAPGEVEDAICRLAQLARAAGIHLIIATQRPSVNVITGLIKANIPSRIAFAVSSAIDSRTIIDGSGAEKLLGKGDMLFFPSGYPKPVRVQGAFISDKEVHSVVEFLKKNNSEAQYSEEIKDRITNAKAMDNSASSSGGSDLDDYFVEAGKFIIDKDKASIGMLQRVYKIGFNRAARIMDQLAEAGVVGPEEGTKPRKILMSLEQFEQYIDEN